MHFLFIIAIKLGSSYKNLSEEVLVKPTRITFYCASLANMAMAKVFLTVLLLHLAAAGNKKTGVYKDGETLTLWCKTKPPHLNWIIVESARIEDTCGSVDVLENIQQRCNERQNCRYPVTFDCPGYTVKLEVTYRCENLTKNIKNEKTGKSYMIQPHVFTPVEGYCRAEERCKKYGFDLPEPDSIEDVLFLSTVQGNDYFYVGISDYTREGHWLYGSDDAAVTYFDWYVKAHHDWDDEDCAIMKRTLLNVTIHRGWHTVHCTDNVKLLVCEIKPDQCSSNPCQNGATCENALRSFKCHCPAPWWGKTCTQGPCDSNHCKHGGRCQNVPTGPGYKCDCVGGWGGNQCAQDIRHIDPVSGKQYILKDNENENPAFDYDHAVKACSKARGKLPEPKNEEEDNFLQTLLSKRLQLLMDYVPLGMKDDDKEGTWRFGSDNSLVNYTDWIQWSWKPEPNGGSGENCAFWFLDGYGNVGWVDGLCSRRIDQFLCDITSWELIVSSWSGGIITEDCQEVFHEVNTTDESFLCTVADPKLKIHVDATADYWYWSKDGKPIPETETETMYVTRDAKMITLTFKRLREEDEGKYACHHKQDKKSFTLNIVGGEKIVELQQYEGRFITFSCPNNLEKEGRVYEWQWEHEIQSISKDIRHIDLLSGKQYILKHSEKGDLPADYDYAVKACSKAKGKLPEPKNEEEENFLKTLLSKRLHLNGEYFPLGMKDDKKEGAWMFGSDNSSVNYTNWYQWSPEPEPNGGSGENCAFWWVDYNDRIGWADYACSRRIEIFLCDITSSEHNGASLYDVFGSGRKEWSLAFRGTAGVGQSTLEAYMNHQSATVEVSGCRQLPPSATCHNHYRNNAVLDNWKDVDLVAFVLYKNGRRVAHVLFDGQGSDYLNWFSQSRIRNSSFDNLENVRKIPFGLIGDEKASRSFLILEEGDDCDTVAGWTAVVDTPDPVCGWENKTGGDYPRILYASNDKKSNMNGDDVVAADAFGVFVKHKVMGATLTKENLSKDDAGIYKCRIFEHTCARTASQITTYNLTVYDPPQVTVGVDWPDAPFISPVKETCDEFRQLNETGQAFQCFIQDERGHSNSNWFWSKDGTTNTVIASKVKEYNYDFKLYYSKVLYFERITEEDQGTYICSYKGFTNSFTLKLVEAETVELEAYEGEDLTFSCPNNFEKKGHTYDWQWEHDGQHLSSVKVEDLKKKSLTKADAGSYKCTIFDEYCKTNTNTRQITTIRTFSLKIYAPIELLVTHNAIGHFVQEECVQFRPLNETEQLFECVINDPSGFDDCDDWGWTKNGTVISENQSNNVFVEKDDSQHRTFLHFKKITKEDKGIYNCSYKGITKSFMLTPGEETIELQAEEGGDITFPCPMRHKQVGLIDWDWTHKGRRIVRRGEGKAYVTRKNLRREDAGIYKCKIEDSDCFGDSIDQRTFNLKVLLPCGRRSTRTPAEPQRRIHSAQEAPAGSAPWHVILREDRKFQTFCGGALIAPDTVLTAASCVTKFQNNFRYPFKPHHIMIYLGTRNCNGEAGVYRKLKSYIVHPRFNGTFYNNDLAIFKLDKPVVYSDDIRPICLEKEDIVDELLKPGRMGVVTGCGRANDNGRAPTFLHEVELPISARNFCQERANVVDGVVTQGMFCAGYYNSLEGKTCHGDIGGPFVLESEGRAVLAGLVSWGVECDPKNHYGFYTQVAHYYDWIMENI